MFERFSSRARHAIVLAQEEARGLDHAHIDTEHILLGLLAEPDSVAAKVLAGAGIDLTRCRDEVIGIVGRGDSAPRGHIPFTARAKKVLELSLREALALGHNYIGTEHILLGLEREHEGVATRVLTELGVIDQVRPLTLAEIQRTASGAAEPSPQPRRTAGAEALITVAEQLAGPAPMGTHHLLEAMSLVDGTLAAGALGALGVGPEALVAKIDELGTAGTTDASPEVEATQQMTVHISAEELRVVLRDPAALALAQQLSTIVGTDLDGSGPTGGLLIGLWQANVDALRALVGRVDPGDDEDTPAGGSGRSAIVRAALRNRLRRRSR